jgi:16S rRNA processing protein RimM
MKKQALVRIGRCLRPHGLKGDVLVHAFTEDPLSLGSYGPVYVLPSDLENLILDQPPSQSFTLENIRPGPQTHYVLVAFHGLTTRTHVEEFLKSPRDLFIPRTHLKDESLEDDEFFHTDLIGLAAYDPQGILIGHVIAVHNFGAGDLLEIAYAPPSSSNPKKTSKTFLIPFRQAFVPDVTIKEGRLTIVYETDTSSTQESTLPNLK